MAAIVCSSCGHLDTGAFCSQCGKPLAGNVRAEPNVVVQLLRVPLESVFDYFTHAIDIVRPQKLANGVKAGQYGPVRLLKLALATTILGSAIAVIGPEDPSLQAARPMPFFSELLDALGLILANVLASLPMHLILRRWSRSVTFGQYAAISVVTGALLTPPMALASTLWLVSGADPLFGLLTLLLIGQTVYIFPYTALYELPMGRVALWYVIGTVIAIFVAFAVAFLMLFAGVPLPGVNVPPR
jgi:hypothetical protein